MTPTPLTFTPPASGSTRLSADVWELLCSHAADNGNSSTREALEQLVRQTLGQPPRVITKGLEPLPEASQPSAPSHNAAAALDALLLE